jgi:interferon gamma-inducible protein 30
MEDETASLMPQTHSAWYARRRVPLLLLAGACALLIIVMAGPPRSRAKTESGLPGEPDHASVHGGPAGGAAAAASAAAAAGGCGKVRVDFFGESLCPDCQHMVRDVLGPMFSNGIADLIDLRYHAFGNVHNNSDGSWRYQHGDNEGKYNRYILCAQHFHAKQADW